MRKWIGWLACGWAWAAPPAIVDGPRVEVLQKSALLIRWRTTESAGAASTLAEAMGEGAPGSFTTVQVAAGTGANFPPGSIVKVDRERMRVAARSGDSLTLARGYDAEVLTIFGQTLTSLVSAGGTCTVTTPMDHFYSVGDKLRVQRASGINSGVTFTVATVPDATSFTFQCAGAPDAAYTLPALMIRQYPEAHASGATITRIDSDAQVCYGTTTAYGSASRSPDDAGVDARQSVNHFVYVAGLTPGATYHFKVQSTPRSTGPSNCESPGPDTAESADLVVTTAAASEGDQVPQAPSENGRTWDFSAAAAFATDALAAANCSDLQAKINAAAAADGNLNHRVRIPAQADCQVNLTLPAKNGPNAGGTGKLVLTTDTEACLPPEGIRINAAWHEGCMPRLYTGNFLPALTVGPNASYWIIRGVEITAHPLRATATFVQDFSLISSLIGADTDFDVAADPHHLALSQVWAHCPAQNNHCRGIRLHGDYIAVKDSVVGPTHGFGDLGAVQIDGFDSQYVYIHNNELSGVMSGYYQSDNGYNARDTIFDRNHVFKPLEWNKLSHRFQFGVELAVASATAGTTTTIATVSDHGLSSGRPVAFAGATGNWAGLNYRTWSVRDGTLHVTVSAGVATATTSTPHGLVTGDRISVGGAHYFPCLFLSSAGASSAVTVTGPASFTFPTPSLDFSTQSGEQCRASDITIHGPVFEATVTSANTFTVPLNSSGFGALTGAVTAAYPQERNIKNTFEFKSGIRALIEGNIIENSWSQNQSGQLLVLTVRGAPSFNGWALAQGETCWSCRLAITDVEIRNNILRNGCSGLALLGTDNLSAAAPEQRIRMRNNLLLNISRANNGSGTCTGSSMQWFGSYDDVTYSHNTSLSEGRTIFEQGEPQSGKIYLEDSIIDAADPMTNGLCVGAGLRKDFGCSPYNYREWSFRRNVMFGDEAGLNNPFSSDPWNGTRRYFSGEPGGSGSLATYQDNFWPNSHAGVGFAGVRTIVAATNTAPIVVTTATPHGCSTGDYVRVMDTLGTGNTNMGGLWMVRVVSSTQLALIGSSGNGTFSGTATLMGWAGACASPGNLALLASSPYQAGTAYVAPAGPPSYGTAGQGAATDGSSVGADVAAVRAAVGELELASVAATASGATFTYTAYAGAGETCVIDTSNDGFATFTRTIDSGSGTARATAVGGLQGDVAYQFRLQCPSASVAGEFFTSTTAAGPQFRGAGSVEGGVRIP
jgi:hypothetical protein